MADLNRRLSHKANRRTDGSALSEIESILRIFKLRGVFTPVIAGTGEQRKVTLEKDDAAWALRRRGDGLNVILAHPDVEGTGPELAKRYFAKDAIEKDFQTIKSVVELRPIHHRTDHKVNAHVTVCMLALLLLRVLDDRLKPAKLTSAAALELLEPVRLNLMCEEKSTFYSVTRPKKAVSALLAALGANDLADDAKVAEFITPR